MKSKTIILSTNEKFIQNSPRAILTFIEDNNLIDGKIRLYNLSKLDNGVKLGIYYNQKVISANLSSNKDCYTFKINEKINLSSDIYCALIDTLDNNKLVLSGGSSPSFEYSFEEEDEVELSEDFQEEIKVDQPQILEQETKNEENLVETESQPEQACMQCDCKNCKYKEYFYASHHDDGEQIENQATTLDNTEQNQIQSIQENNVEQTENIETESSEITYSQEAETLANKLETESQQIQQDETKTTNSEAENFLNSISEQLNEMFLSYPIDEEITKIIPNSKIVKVTDSVDNSSYVVGVLYENDQIAYLVYGVPAKYNETPPAELGENYQWLPLDPEDPLSDGYYLIYQDASSGKLVPVKVE